MRHMRLKHEAKGDTCKAKVFHNSEWQEYVVKFYKDGVQLIECQYHTDDLDDAKRTADVWVAQRTAQLNWGKKNG